MKICFASLLVLSLLFISSIKAQTSADSSLVAEINKIKAIDNHAHPLRASAAGEKPDDEYDALPLDSIEMSLPPIRLRPDNPEYVGAWRALYAYAHDDMSEAHLKELLSSKQREMSKQGDAYPAWVLDKLGIETMLANRIAMGRGLLDKSRFRWVSFVDALMLPLNNQRAGGTNPDQSVFYKGETNLRERYLSELNLKQMPADLNGYLTKVVSPTLERQKREGVIAVKFEVAYLRPLDFSDVS